MFKIRNLLVISLLTISTSSYCSVGGDLNSFFNGLGFESNVTASHAYQGQQAGYYSAGSAYLRNSVKNIQLLHIETPSINAGCGGIDAYLGGFSFFNADEFNQLLQSVMSNAAGYAEHLALETMVPQVDNILKYIEDQMQKLNNLNINSCETAQNAVGGLWPQNTAAQTEICKDVGTQSGLFSDWADAREQCATQSGFDSSMSKASQDEKYKDMITKNTNMIWSALQKNSFFSSDKELAELSMSLSGTVVFDANDEPTPYPSLSGDRNLMKALLNGGTATIYGCEDDDCLSVNAEKEITIQPENSLFGKVNSMLVDISNSIHNDTGLTDAEKGFINTTKIPIYKFISVSQQAGQDDLSSLLNYSQLIANDLLSQYLSESLHLIQYALSQKKLTPDLQKKLESDIDIALDQVAELKMQTNSDIQSQMQLQNETQKLEQSVTSAISEGLDQSNSYSEG